MSRRPRVGILARPIEQGTSGSGSHLAQLVEHVAALNDSFDLFLIKYRPKKLEIPGIVEEIVIPRDPLRSSLRLRGYRFDVLHYSPLTVLSPMWVPGAHKVATIHGFASLQLPKTTGRLRTYHTAHVLPHLMRRMEYIFTVSQTTAKGITDMAGIQPDRIRITFNAPSSDFRRHRPNEAKEYLMDNYGIGPPFLVHISKFSERKNPWMLLQALKKIIGEPDFHHMKAVIIGAGWDNDQVVSLLESTGLRDHVLLPGYLPRSDIAKFLNVAEVFLFPSLYEGFGMPNIEAMACGCPVVTSRAFAIPEIVGDAALLVDDPMDPSEIACKVLTVLRDRELRGQLVCRGLAVSGRYDWRESARTVLATYAECVQGKP